MILMGGEWTLGPDKKGTMTECSKNDPLSLIGSSIFQPMCDVVSSRLQGLPTSVSP